MSYDYNSDDADDGIDLGDFAGSTVSVEDVTEMLGVCRRTVYRLIDAGRIRTCQLGPRGKHRLDGGDVGRLAEKRVKRRED